MANRKGFACRTKRNTKVTVNSCEISVLFNLKYFFLTHTNLNVSRNGNLQLSAGRQTAYKPVLHSHCDLYKRTVTHLNEALSSDFQPLFGELDVVGMVVYVRPAPQGNSGFQTVYLADSDFSILGVAFWAGIKVKYVLVMEKFYTTDICLKDLS